MRTLDLLPALLKPTGLIVTIDPVWLPKQRLFVKLMNAADIGLNIRTPTDYRDLMAGRRLEIESGIFDDLPRIPYDHFTMIGRPLT